MNPMNPWIWLEFLGERVLHATWQAASLTGIVLVLQRVLQHRLSPRWRHALWFPVLLRLALPFTPPASFSLFRWVPVGERRFTRAEGLSVEATPSGASTDVAERASGANPFPAGSSPDPVYPDPTGVSSAAAHWLKSSPGNPAPGDGSGRSAGPS